MCSVMQLVHCLCLPQLLLERHVGYVQGYSWEEVGVKIRFMLGLTLNNVRLIITKFFSDDGHFKKVRRK